MPYTPLFRYPNTATPLDARVVRRYESFRAEPDSPEKREAERNMERLVAPLGSVRLGGYLYQWDARYGELRRHRAAACGSGGFARRDGKGDGA